MALTVSTKCLSISAGRASTSMSSVVTTALSWIILSVILHFTPVWRWQLVQGEGQLLDFSLLAVHFENIRTQISYFCCSQCMCCVEAGQVYHDQICPKLHMVNRNYKFFHQNGITASYFKRKLNILYNKGLHTEVHGLHWKSIHSYVSYFSFSSWIICVLQAVLPHCGYRWGQH